MANIAYPTTFNLLQAELQRYVEDDTSEYSSDVLNIIARAEDKVAQDLDLELFKGLVEDTLTISDPEYTRPSDCILVRWIYIPDTNTFIERASMQLCKMLGGTGLPRKYAEQGDDGVLYLAPTPDQAYAIEVGVLVRPTPLASDNQTNWLTDNVPNLLLFAALIESEQYLIDEGGRVDGFRAQYATDLALAKKQYMGRERNDEFIRPAPPPQQPAA